MNVNRPRLFSRVPAVCLMVVLAGCSGDSGIIQPSSVTNPSFEPEVDIETDDFSFEATGLTNVSQSVSYSWQHTGAWAIVTQSSRVSIGTATLTIRDARGRQVYSRGLGDNGTFASGTGVPGAWTIQLELSNVSGTRKFSVQRGG